MRLALAWLLFLDLPFVCVCVCVCVECLAWEGLTRTHHCQAEGGASTGA